MPDHFKPDPKRAIEFLSWLNPDASLYIEHMRSEGQARPTPKIYTPTELTAATKFVAVNNSEEFRRNIYFLANNEFLQGKRGKGNLTSVRFLHVDLDFKDYPGDENEVSEALIDRLIDEKRRPIGVPIPTVINFTGGGYQALWRLVEPITVEQAEELNKLLLELFMGGSGTHDASRLLRLPYTMNWLNEKKRATGREPDVAMPIHLEETEGAPTSYSIEDFKIKRAVTKAVANSAGTSAPNATEVIEPKQLPEELSTILPSEPKWVEAIVDGIDPPGHSYNSRSELVFAAVIWLLGRKVEPGHVVSIITEPELKISAHVLENPNPLKYAQRQVARGLGLITAKRGDWPKRGEGGLPTPNLPENVRHALSQLGVSAQRNMFTLVDEIGGNELDGRDLNDIADILASVFSRELGYGAQPATIKRELLAIAHENSYHPVIDYLDSVQWDGKPRIDTWLADYCNAERNELNSEFGAKFLIAGIRRIKKPGVKFDSMLVLEGAQGAGKSSLAAILAIRDEWFCGSLDLKSDDKTKAEMLARAWIVECQELDGLNKATSESLKRFLSTSTDTYRRAYARNAGEYRRHCVIIGTTNEDSYLRDHTGNRRFWPVQVGEIDLEGLKADMGQLWAEAANRETNGESISLSRHLWQTSTELQTKRMIEDAYADRLIGEFDNRTGRVSMDSIKMLLNIDTARMTPMDARRIKSIMANLGWEHGNHRLHDLGGTRLATRKGFARGTPEERKIELVTERIDGNVSTLIEFTRYSNEEPF